MNKLHNRREWLWMAGSSALLGQPNDGQQERQRRIGDVIHAYEQQGLHRTATDTDRISGEWLMNEVRRAGLEPSAEKFLITRIDPVKTTFEAAGRKVEGLPLFDGGQTGPDGLRGRLGPLGSDVPIGVTELVPNGAERGAIIDARRNQSGHQAIVAVTRGGRPGLCPSNAESFLRSFGPPVLQVSSAEASWLADLVRKGSDAVLTSYVTTKVSEAFNVTTRITGSDPRLAPLVIMTPRSGWWTCASERGGGIACWLELMRAIRAARPAREILFVASTGHEIGQRGIEVFTERRPDLIKKSRAWIHLGANIGAAQEPGNTIQASDGDMEALLAAQLVAAGLSIDRRVPRGTVPGGEAGVVHRGGGRYVSIIGRNALFHNPADQGPEAVDVNAIERFAGAFIAVARTLAAA